MARWFVDPRVEKKLKKRLRREDIARAKRFLGRLSQQPPPASLNLHPMQGHDDLWEMKAGGQNRFILKRMKDETGDYFLVIDVGPHDVYGDYGKK